MTNMNACKIYMLFHTQKKSKHHTKRYFHKITGKAGCMEAWDIWDIIIPGITEDIIPGI